MNIDAIIQRAADEALAEGRRMVHQAMEEINRQLAFARRSRGQKRRHERQRKEQGESD